MTSLSKTIYQFGPFRIDTERYILFRGDELVPLSPKVFETLLFLVQNRGRVGRKEEIINAIWPDTFVAESNLAQNVFLLRKALGEGKGEHRYIVTIPGRGYRFVAPVEEFGATNSDQSSQSDRVGSIAVLPFTDLLGAEKDSFLGPGLADALIMRLSSLQHLTVRPTTAVLKYADLKQDLLLIGRELGVDALLDGTFQREGERIRVSVQLVGLRDRRTLWAARFDEKFTGIFTIQDTIAEQVISSLAVKLSSDEERQLRKQHTTSPEAFQLCIKGRYFWNQRTTEGLRKGLIYAQQAIEIDPAYALAYVGLADSYSLLGAQHGVLKPQDAFPKAHAAARKALELDDRLAEAYASLGFVDCCYSWDWLSAEKNYLRAIELKPNYSTAHHWFGEMLTIRGRHDEAYLQLRTAQEMDPLSLAINVDLAASFYFARQYEKSEAQLCDLLELNPNFMRAHLVLGRVYAQEGKYQKAIESLERAVNLSGNDPLNLCALAHVFAVAGKSPEAYRILVELHQTAQQRYIPPSQIAAVYAGLGEHELAFTLLNQALELRDIEVIWLKVNPLFDPLRSDSRFTDLIEGVNSWNRKM